MEGVVCVLNEAVGVVLEVVAVGIATVVDDDVAALLGGSVIRLHTARRL